MKRHFLKLLAAGTLIVPTIASAQLTITFSQSTQNLAPGASTAFQAILENTSSVYSLDLKGFDFSTHTDLTIDDTAIYNIVFAPTTLAPNQSLALQNIFTVTLASNPFERIPFTYDQNSILVSYEQNNIPSDAIQAFTVKSQTPTPPVVLVTLLSGIGTVRMALRSRKKA